MHSSTLTRAGRVLRTHATVLGASLGTLWAAFIVDAALGGALLSFGILRRTLIGLRGIAFAPFIHGSLNYLIANTVPFLMLGWLVMVRDARHVIPVTLSAMVGSGLFGWLFGWPGSMHIGASGVIFGSRFLMLAGWYARSWGSIALSVLVTVTWGGLVLGVLPSQPGISWQGHLGGFIGGVFAARMFRTR